MNVGKEKVFSNDLHPRHPVHRTHCRNCLLGDERTLDPLPGDLLMTAITNIVGIAHDLTQEAAQRLIENPMLIVGIAVAAFGGALLAGFVI